MIPKTLIIKRLIRVPHSGIEEELAFESGVNVIVGKANTGKTKWLAMLDYLMGDSGTPEEAFGFELSEKYDSIRALICIGDDEFWLERRWKERGLKTKVFINEELIGVEDFSRFLFKKLGIPVLHFPKGSPYAERTWSELSWRTLLRHVYRQQRFWGEFADQQPESEQRACLMQFLGMAEYLFSEQYDDLVTTRKEIWKLEGKKEQFLLLLDRISKEIIEEKELRVALTSDSIDLAIVRLKSEIDELQQRREKVLAELRGAIVEEPMGETREPTELERLGELWAELQSKREENLTFLARTERRIAELQEYKTTVADELSRVERARSAGQVLINLKVTHCPVCDQPITQTKREPGHCFLCDQPWQDSQVDPQGADDRISFELKRLQEELQEAEGLIIALSSERDEMVLSRRRIEEQAHQIDSQLRPVRQAVAAILPPEIAMLDTERGRLQERVSQLERIKVLLEIQNEMSKEIDRLQHEEGLLRSQVAQISQKIDFEQAGDKLTEGMNTFLNVLEAGEAGLWTQSRVHVKLNDRSFKVTIDGENWSTKLGGTLRLYFLFSYHYALLRLTEEDGRHYPGLVILDLPPTIEDDSTIRDKENFVVEPFIDLMNRPGMEKTQVIVAGAAFEGLEGAHRIELNHVWV